MSVSPFRAFASARRLPAAVAVVAASATMMSVMQLATPRLARAQATTAAPVEPFTMSVGRALPLDFTAPVTQVTVANPSVADVVVLTATSVVINAKAIGETDILLSGPALGRRHLRVVVHQATEERQIALGVKFAEVRRDALYEFGVSARYKAVGNNTTGGTGSLPPATPTTTRTEDRRVRNDGTLFENRTLNETVESVSTAAKFIGGLLTFGTPDISAFIEAQEQAGRARSLAEPTIVAGNREEADFIAGGEIPIPVFQPNQGGSGISIQYRRYGVQLKFRGEVISDSLIKLKVTPEVSSLDFGSAVLLSGFRIPAIRTRRVETTLDVRPGESLVISGLFNEERESVRTGIPGLMKLPILGALFSSSRWQNAESELLVVVTPELFDPNMARGKRTIQLQPDTTKPALDAIKKRLPPE